MFQFPGYGSAYPILFRYGYCDMTRSGLPHSEIHGSKPACGYPWLFVARYVLLRPLAPRHPPYALYNLTFISGFHKLRISLSLREPAILNVSTIRLRCQNPLAPRSACFWKPAKVCLTKNILQLVTLFLLSLCNFQRTFLLSVADYLNSGF